MPPAFLSCDDVLEIHKDLIRAFGGSEGVRDMGLLQSAVAMPQSGFGDAYFYSDHFEMAAAYLFHLVQNHPFIDGNKRTGLVAAIAFLGINRVELQADPDALFDLVMGVARSACSKAEVAVFLKQNTRARR